MQYASFPWDKLKDALLRRVDVTQAYAIEQDWGWRLSARIFDLKKQDWPIETSYDGGGYAHYSLPLGWKPPQRKTAPGNGAARSNNKVDSNNAGGES